MPVAVLGRLGTELPTDVAGRLGRPGQEGLDPWPEGLHLPRHPRAVRPRGRTGRRAGTARTRTRPRTGWWWWWSSRRRVPWSWWWSGWAGPRRTWPGRPSELGERRGTHRVGGQVVEDLPHHRCRGGGPEAGLVDDADHHVLRRRRVGPHPTNQAVGSLPGSVSAVPVLPARPPGKRGQAGHPVGGAAPVVDHPLEAGEQGLVVGRRDGHVAGDLGVELLDHLARRGRRRPPPPAGRTGCHRWRRSSRPPPARWA